MKAIVGKSLLTVAGAAFAIFALAIFVLVVVSFSQTVCWRDTTKPFNEKLVYGGSLLKPGLGNFEVFSIEIHKSDDPEKSCLHGIYFVDREKSYHCPQACGKSGLDSDTVEHCQEDCASKCGVGNGDCIVLVPKKAKWYDATNWFATRNKPIVYSSGKFELDFDAGLVGLDKGIKPDGGEICVLFSSSGKDSYSVVASSVRDDCNEQAG